MTEQIGLWRATYTPGDWVVLGGPTSLVILQPAPAHRADLVEQLWEVVLQADSLDALVVELAAYNVNRMPDFAAFFWHDDAMRSLIRGDLAITDLDSGDLVADGSDIQTWTEVGLGGVRRVRVASRWGEDASSEESLRLPLVVGAVTAGSVELDATGAARVSSPQGSDSVAASPIPIPGQPPVPEIEAARSAVVEAEVVDEPDEADESPLFDDSSSARLARLREEEPDDFAPFAEQEANRLFGQPQQSNPFAAPSVGNPFAPAQPPAPAPTPPMPTTPPAAAAAPPPMPPADPHDPFSVAAVQDREDRRLAGAPPAGGAAPTPPPVPQEGQVLGVLCALNHANPPEAQRCRRCGGALQGQPRLMPRPVMAVLRPSSGQPVEVDRSVLIGRSPQADKVSRAEIPHLLTVVSPSTDISRTHLQVRPEEWEVIATDLHSTNGTLLIRPGQPEPERMPPGEPIQVFPGCVLDLGDGVSILVDHPA